MKFITVLIPLVAVAILFFVGFTVTDNLGNMDYEQLLDNTTSTTLLRTAQLLITIIPLIAAIGVIVSVVFGLFAYRDSGAYAEEVYSDTTEEPEEEDDEQQETIVGYKCKNCGAPIHFNNGDPLTTCEYCKHQMKRRL